MNFKISLLFLAILKLINAQPPIQYCTPVAQNIGPNDFPKLPDEFQSRIEMNFISQQRNNEVFIIYDKNDNRAEFSIKEQDNSYKQIYYFDRNEIFTIRDDSCTASMLNQTNENAFFGLIQGSNGLEMKPPNFFLNFNNGFPHRKLDRTTWRGIPVNHFQSCQTWTDLRASVLVDYYFKVPDYKLAVSYLEDLYNEIPIASTIVGYVDINNTAQTYRNVSHEYNFYEFRSIVERKPELFNLPEGVFCDGQTYQDEIPKLPESFSFFVESVSPSQKFVSGTKIFYSKKLNSFRFDLQSAQFQAPAYVNDPVRIVHDFNSGVGYAINKNRGNCTFYPIGTLGFDLADNAHLSDGFSTLKSPEMLFYIDDTYYYVGERYERGLLCNVFVSKRTDFNVTGVEAEYYVFELYILKPMTTVDESTDQREQVVPISVHITAPGTNFSIIDHYYDFDSKLDRDQFDISQCFQGSNRINFGIRFDYPPSVDKESFSQFYGKYLEEDFDEQIYKSFKVFSASPLRIVPPRFEAHEEGFIVYSGLTNFPDAINHFTKEGRPRVNVQKIKHGIFSNSPESCAYLCLTDSVYTVPLDYKCMSFDVCSYPSGGLICSFYNYTLQTDPDVILDTAPECDHFSKITKEYDSADVNALFRMIEEAVLRKEFNLSVRDQGIEILTFPSSDIFVSTVDTTTEVDSPGQTSFFKQFTLVTSNDDFNETAVISDPRFLLRKKFGVSVDECTRLCLFERSYNCEIFTYGKALQECKWSSLPLQSGEQENYLDNLIVEKSGYELFIKDPLYSYIKYPFKVTSMVDYTVSDVTSESECAIKCNKESKFRCRSFNFCDGVDGKSHRCLLSSTNVHNQDKDPNIIDTTLCSHYSKNPISDFQLVSQTKLSLNPQNTLFNASIERCAETCILEDSFFCRSFDFKVGTDTCFLYKENLKDKILIELGIQSDRSCNHYSRLYYEENGVLKTVEAITTNKPTKYGGFTIFGVVAAVAIGGILMGVMIAFVYLKVTKKSDLMPVMRFVNPNYAE